MHWFRWVRRRWLYREIATRYAIWTIWGVPMWAHRGRVSVKREG